MTTSEINLGSKPIYSLNNGFKLRNYGIQYTYPPQRLIKGLKELIIFTENNKKRDIPNGSVWVYEPHKTYKSEILKTDIGCGITAAITEKLDFDDEGIKQILNSINEMGIDIGQGNHFIDFTNSYEQIERDNSMIFLHSDFNRKNYLPTTFSEAAKLEKNAIETRKEFLEKLIDKLGVKGKIHQDWTHNSVRIENDNITYRKGSINLKETDNEGILALNPFEGLYSYAAEFKKYHNSMQHGTNKKNVKKIDASTLNRIKVGGAIGMIPPTELPEDIYQHYNSKEDFDNQFLMEQSPIQYFKPKLVVKTKF